jgi:hypothetical protein
MGYTVYNIFANLSRKLSVSKDCFFAASLPFNFRHKIGISPEGYPMFFIDCNNTSNSIDINLKFISVLFDRPCKLFEDNSEQINEIFTIIFLKTENTDTQRYFIDVVSIIIEQLPEYPSHTQLKSEIRKLVDLFSNFNKVPLKTIQGLWGELFLIEQAKNPEYLIQSWHANSRDKFDFNDGKDKIEVKSTSQVRRKHTFSLEQLNPNQNSNLLIASLFVVQTGNGKSIFDLKDTIYQKVQNLQLQFHLNEILSQILGSEFDKVFDVYFDYQQAHDTLVFYDFKDIPTINSKIIPNDISNIRFDCDLSNLETIKDKDLDITQSPLFSSLMI